MRIRGAQWLLAVSMLGAAGGCGGEPPAGTTFRSAVSGAGDQAVEKGTGEVVEDAEAQARRRRPAPRPPVRRPGPREPGRGPIVIVPGPPVIGVPALNPTVMISGNQFNPASITVPIGTTVTWVNGDPVDHTVTSPPPGMAQTVGAFDGQVPPGATFVFTFNAPGQFQYFCRIHPEMRGTVNVVDPLAAAPVEDPAAAEPEPPAAAEPAPPAAAEPVTTSQPAQPTRPLPPQPAQVPRKVGY